METRHNIRESAKSDPQIVHILELTDVKYKIYLTFCESLKMRKRANTL